MTSKIEIFNDIDKLAKWFEWMTNKHINSLGNINIKSPALSKDKAFEILYTLQEYFRVSARPAHWRG